MNQIPQKTMEGYFRIYEQICDDPLMSIQNIAQETSIARSTVSRHVREMNELGIMFGPVIYLKGYFTDFEQAQVILAAGGSQIEVGP